MGALPRILAMVGAVCMMTACTSLSGGCYATIYLAGCFYTLKQNDERKNEDCQDSVVPGNCKQMIIIATGGEAGMSKYEKKVDWEAMRPVYRLVFNRMAVNGTPWAENSFWLMLRHSIR